MIKKNQFFTNTMGYFAELAIASTVSAAVDYEAFVAAAVVGSIAAFWESDGTILATGDLADAANAKRTFFYAHVDASGITKRTRSIVAGNAVIESAAYNAGAAQVSTATFAGTISTGQILHVRIIQTTGTQVPYPSWEYSTVVSGTVTAATAALVVLINAEKVQKFVTASSSTNVLTLTAANKEDSFKIVAYVETTTAAPTDATAFTFATTTKQKSALGDASDIAELVRYYKINQGNVEYAAIPTVDGDDFGYANVNISGSSTWGFIIVKERREETGVTRNYTNNAKIVIAVPTGQVAGLVALTALA